MSKDSIHIAVDNERNPQAETTPVPQAPKKKMNLKTLIMLWCAKLGMKAHHFITAEVMDSKGRVGKVQFIFTCRPWLSRMHIDGINQLAAEQAVAMKMMTPTEVRQVVIVLIAKMGID